METNSVLTLVGWSLLLSSWITPYVMNKLKYEDTNKHMWGMILAAISCGIFLSQLIISMMK